MVKTAGGVIKLEAEGDLTIDSGDLGITPFMEANRINLLGRMFTLNELEP